VCDAHCLTFCASLVQDVLETKLEKKRKNLLGPPSGRKMLFFIDDLNMPALEVRTMISRRRRRRRRMMMMVVVMMMTLWKR
jgi:hypothetical protein